MSDACGSTAGTHESETERGLSVYRDSHRSVARYMLILKENFTSNAAFKVVQKCLPYLTADSECNRLNAGRTRTGFGAPVYSITLENPEEALRAVSIAADGYWSQRHSERTH